MFTNLRNRRQNIFLKTWRITVIPFSVYKININIQQFATNFNPVDLMHAGNIIIRDETNTQAYRLKPPGQHCYRIIIKLSLVMTLVILTVAIDGFQFLKLNPTLIIILFPIFFFWYFHGIYIWTTCVPRPSLWRGGVFKRCHCPGSSLAQRYPPKKGGFRDAYIVYRMFIAGEVSVYRIKIRTHLDNASDIHELNPEIAISNI